MAWRSHGTSNATLIASLTTNNLITSPRVASAMTSTDRAHFSPTAPYQDTPQSIGHGATISAPHMHANAAESLLPYLHPGARVLDIGSGSGYLTCVLARLVQPGGEVVGVEHIEALRAMGERNARKSEEGAEMVREGRVRFVKGDGRMGWKEGAPWDAIHVGAASRGFVGELVEQLGRPGR